MLAYTERELQIEDLRNHSPEMVNTLRILMERGAGATPDPKRPDFFEVESESLVYYIHVSPTSGKILLLATWPTESALDQSQSVS
jgi:hypothetical protein